MATNLYSVSHDFGPYFGGNGGLQGWFLFTAGVNGLQIYGIDVTVHRTWAEPGLEPVMCGLYPDGQPPRDGGTPETLTLSPLTPSAPAAASTAEVYLATLDSGFILTGGTQTARWLATSSSPIGVSFLQIGQVIGLEPSATYAINLEDRAYDASSVSMNIWLAEDS